METVLMAILFMVFGYYTVMRETEMNKKRLESEREYRQDKYDYERDWEKYPPPKWVLEMYESKEKTISRIGECQ